MNRADLSVLLEQTIRAKDPDTLTRVSMQGPGQWETFKEIQVQAAIEAGKWVKMSGANQLEADEIMREVLLDYPGKPIPGHDPMWM